MILEDGPKHTKDLNQAKLDLDKFGYCLIPDVLNDNEIRIGKTSESRNFFFVNVFFSSRLMC